MAAARKAHSSSAEPPARKPLDFALLRLGRRAHSEGELSEKMRRAGYSTDEIQHTLDFLLARHYLDDTSFAREYARSSLEHKRWGPRRIEQRLRELKIDERRIEAALDDVFAEGEDGPAAEALEHFFRVRKRSAEPARDRARAYRHLLSRGFSPEVVYQLVSRGDFEDTD